MGNPDFGSKCWDLISILFSIPFTLFNFMFWLLCFVGQRNLFVPPTVELVKTEKSAEKTIVLIILWCFGLYFVCFSWFRNSWRNYHNRILLSFLTFLNSISVVSFLVQLLDWFCRSLFDIPNFDIGRVMLVFCVHLYFARHGSFNFVSLALIILA